MPRSPEHAKYMRLALELADGGIGWVAPNPLVGAVIVLDGRVAGQGYHAKFGGPHAEAAAIADALKSLRAKKRDLSRATLYVTLEPCNHYGKQPPCTEAIIRAGIKHVVYAVDDENPLTAGQAKSALASHGVDVESDVLRTRALRQNEVFFHNQRHGSPFVVMKAAVTLDGKIATATGDSRWISSPVSRAQVHLMRQRYDAVLVGVGTIIADDPRLTVREEALSALKRAPSFVIRQPTVAVIDRRLDIPHDCALLRENAHLKRRIFVVCAPQASAKRRQALGKLNRVHVIESKLDRRGRFDFEAVYGALWGMGVTSVIVEGGGSVYTSLLEQRAAQKVVLFVAPRILGGDGLSLAGPLGVRELEDCYNVKDMAVRKSGHDIVVEGYL